MAKLPGPYDARPTPSPSRAIATISDPGRVPRARAQAAAEEGAVGTAAIRAEGDAQQGVIRSNLTLADSLSRTADHLFTIGRQMQERRDRLAYTQARSRFLQAKVVADAELTDDDYSTYGERYAKRVAETRDEIAQGLNNRIHREEFLAETDLDITQGVVHQHERAVAKEKDLGRANLSASLETNVEAVTRASDEPTRESLIKASNDAIRVAQENGYISAQEAESERQRFAEVYATNRLSGLNTEQTIVVLEEAKQKQTWASFIPFAERERILDSAKKVVAEKVMDQQAFNTAQSIITGNESYTAQVKAAGQIKDAELHKRVMTLLDTNAARVSRMEKEQQDQLASTALEFLDKNPGATLSDIPAEIRLQMSAADRGYLAQIVKERSQGKPISEERATEMFNEMRDQYLEDPQSVLKWSRLEVAVLPGEYRDRVMAWRKRVGEGDTKVPALESHVTTLANKALADMGLGENKKRRAQYLGELDRQIALFTEEQGRKPMYSEVEAISDRLTIQVAEDGWFGSSKFAFEATDADLAKTVVPDSARDEILGELQSAYPSQSFNDEQIREIYLRWKGVK